MSDFKSVKQLCEEHSNLDLHIHKLDKTITDLEKNNLDLRITISHLKNELDQNKKWTATAYAPNKSAYLQNKVRERDDLLDIANHKSQCQDSKIKQLQEIIKNLETKIDFAVGYISATQPHTDKSPIEVKRWLFEGFERLQ